MNTKLTLNLDKSVIERAKEYAQTKNQSLSAMVENYFRFLTRRENELDMQISPTVLELSGIIELDERFDLKREYQEYLLEKYS